MGEPTKFTVEMLLKHITELASMPVSTSLVPMPKSCLLNGSSKLDLVKVSQWVMISGLQDSCYIALLKNWRCCYIGSQTNDWRLERCWCPYQLLNLGYERKRWLEKKLKQPLTNYQGITFDTSKP